MDPILFGDLKSEDARALYQRTQELHLLWSTVISNLTGISISSVTFIWSFFIKSYISANNPLYVILPGYLSLLLIGLWRLYAHYLDNCIANLYRDFLICEQAMNAPIEHFTTGYLFSGKVPNIKLITSASDLTAKEKDMLLPD